MSDLETIPPDEACRPVVIASHRRSGTHLTIDLLRWHFRVCASWKWPFDRLDTLYLNLESLQPLDAVGAQRRAVKLLSRALRPVIKTHCLPGFPGWSDSHRQIIERLWPRVTVCYVYRDVREVLCSMYVYMQAFDPSTRVSISEFIRQKDRYVDPDAGYSRVQAWRAHVRAWLGQPGVHGLTFRGLVKNTRDELRKLEAVLGAGARYREPLLPAKEGVSRPVRWVRHFRWRPPSTGIISRKPSPKWREVFTRADREFIHREAGETLIDLGFESSSDWVSE